MFVPTWNQLSTTERRAIAEELARDTLRGFFGDYSGFQDMSLDAARRCAVNSALRSLYHRQMVVNRISMEG
jgi:hypothetical protein